MFTQITILHICDIWWIHTTSVATKFLWKDEKLLACASCRNCLKMAVKCKKCPGCANVIVRSKMLEMLLSRYSSWDSLWKAIAWFVRFKKYLVGLLNKDPDSIPKGTVSEVMAAESVIVKAVQNGAFPMELAVVRQGQGASGNQKKCVPWSNPIRNLNPFFAQGISFQTKHPVILQSKHHVTNLIIKNCHRQQGHCGPTQVLAFIRQRSWIVCGLSAVCRVLANCINCSKHNARPGEQIMAQLSSAWVTLTDPPFTHVGVDYVSPLFVKQGRSQVKCYGRLFTCLTMRVVHVEVMHTWEADSFICVYECFFSCRGKPKEVHKDNGTNFTGAKSWENPSLWSGKYSQRQAFNSP